MATDGQPVWVYVVRVGVDPEVEEEWNAWYDDEHLPEILACPGFLSASRFVSRSPIGNSYMTVYAITEPGALRTAEFEARRGWYRFAGAVEFTTDVYRRIIWTAGADRERR